MHIDFNSQCQIILCKNSVYSHSHQQSHGHFLTLDQCALLSNFFSLGEKWYFSVVLNVQVYTYFQCDFNWHFFIRGVQHFFMFKNHIPAVNYTFNPLSIFYWLVLSTLIYMNISYRNQPFICPMFCIYFLCFTSVFGECFYMQRFVFVSISSGYVKLKKACLTPGL